MHDIWGSGKSFHAKDYKLRIPSVYHDFCRLEDGVIAIEFMDGVPLNTYLSTCKDKAARVELAHRILSFVLGSWSRGLVFADPHWGNFIVQQHDDTLAVVDFGTVHQVCEETELRMREVVQLIRAATSSANFFDAVRHCRLSRLYSDSVIHTLFPAYHLFNRVLLTDTTYHFDNDTLEEIHSLLKQIDNVRLQGVVPVTRCLLISISMFCYMDIDLHIKDLIEEDSPFMK